MFYLKQYLCLQEDLRKAILASIQDVDPANPWIKDASGRHTNVMAYLDWPADDSDDSDPELNLAHLRIHGQSPWLLGFIFSFHSVRVFTHFTRYRYSLVW